MRVLENVEAITNLLINNIKTLFFFFFWKIYIKNRHNIKIAEQNKTCGVSL